MKKEKRNKIRTVLLNEFCSIHVNGKLDIVKLDNLSEKGAFIEGLALKHGTFGVINFELPGNMGQLNLNFKVKRSQWAKVKKNNFKIGSGVEFYELNDLKKNILISYVTYLKNKQIITVSRRIIQEFFDKPKL